MKVRFSGLAMHHVTTCFLYAMATKIMAGNYIMVDYFMDPSQSDAFGGACREYLQDSALLLNSHVNPFNLVNYGDNKHCWVVLDAGNMRGARHRLEVTRFSLEEPTADGTCPDYMSLYDGKGENSTTLYGTFCGSTVPNITDFTTQRYLTVTFHTDRRARYKGFQLMATRTEPPPCQADEFHCVLEERCITDKIYCDGTEHCIDGSDEIGCTGLERFVGSFLQLGLGGIIAVGIVTASGVILLTAICCCVKCCKRDAKVSHVRMDVGSVPADTVTVAGTLGFGDRPDVIGTYGDQKHAQYTHV